jgi:hypothetical protein
MDSLDHLKQIASSTGLFSVESKTKYEMVGNNLREYNNFVSVVEILVISLVNEKLIFYRCWCVRRQNISERRVFCHPLTTTAKYLRRKIGNNFTLPC